VIRRKSTFKFNVQNVHVTKFVKVRELFHERAVLVAHAEQL